MKTRSDHYPLAVIEIMTAVSRAILIEQRPHGRLEKGGARGAFKKNVTATTSRKVVYLTQEKCHGVQSVVQNSIYRLR